MRRFRFYNERQNLKIGSSVLITKDEAEHIRKSLRLTKGDTIYIFNGEKEFKAELTRSRNNLTMAKIIEEYKETKAYQANLTVFLALSKATSFEYSLAKLTEVGANKIIPVKTEYSIVNLENKVDKKLVRWQKILTEASKQSERIDVPVITKPIEFKDIEKENLAEYSSTLFFTTKEEEYSELNDVKLGEDIAIFIGPEGDSHLMRRSMQRKT
ncbi:MAG: RsmE family RNA methyltransferase [Candidatus Dojkabacteria bacterium]|nr:RsmE family RNA methyltransferase [Candidatus Dojkabacteria bacterium]